MVVRAVEDPPAYCHGGRAPPEGAPDLPRESESEDSEGCGNTFGKEAQQEISRSTLTAQAPPPRPTTLHDMEL